jgi:hypothetical protein
MVPIGAGESMADVDALITDTRGRNVHSLRTGKFAATVIKSNGYPSGGQSILTVG